MTFLGMRVVIRPERLVLVWDWSDCRSFSRAERRHRQGHRQRVRVRQELDDSVLIVGRVVHMTQRRYDALKAEMQEAIKCLPNSG